MIMLGADDDADGDDDGDDEGHDGNSDGDGDYDDDDDDDDAAAAKYDSTYTRITTRTCSTQPAAPSCVRVGHVTSGL